MSREKGRDLTQSYDKSQYTNRNIQQAKSKYKIRHHKKKIADRLRTVSWWNSNHPTGVVKWVTSAQPSYLPQYPCNVKDKHKTYSPLDDHWVILTTSKTFHYFRAQRDEIRFAFEQLKNNSHTKLEVHILYNGMEKSGKTHGNLILQKPFLHFSCPPQMRRRAKLFVSCCRQYLVYQYTILPFSNLHLPGEIFTCKGVKS